MSLDAVERLDKLLLQDCLTLLRRRRTLDDLIADTGAIRAQLETIRSDLDVEEAGRELA